MDRSEISIDLTDTEWPYTYTDHDRQIVRAIVFDDNGLFYFVRAVRNDEFGNATLIETSGGGVEQGEELDSAIRRELREELGVDVDIVCRIGTVSDYYNLIHRHNINHYYLCRVKSFGDKHLTEDEIEAFHLSTLKLGFEEAVAEYKLRSDTHLGKLIMNRELPVLMRAKELLDDMRDDGLKWETTSTEKLLHTRVFDVLQQSETSDTGISGDYIALDAPDCVVIVPEYCGSFIMVRQWRHGEGRITLEFPGGVVGRGEDPRLSAERELLEETGFRAGSLELIGTCSPNPALFRSRLFFYLASDLEPTGEQHLDEDELINCRIMPIKDVVGSFGTDEMTHAFTGTALAFYLRRKAMITDQDEREELE